MPTIDASHWQKSWPQATLLAKIVIKIQFCISPIGWVNPVGNISVKRRIFPIGKAINQSMFDWIVVQIIHVLLKIIVITNDVLPKSPLPNI